MTLVEGQLEGISKHQSALAQENSHLNDQFQSEIFTLRASLYAMTKELSETKEQLLFVSCFAVLNAVFMVLLTACCRPGASMQPKVLKLGLVNGESEETPREGQDSSSKSDPSRMTFANVAGERSKRRKRTRA